MGDQQDIAVLKARQRARARAGRAPSTPVERAIERYYRQIELTPRECQEVRSQLTEQLAERLEIARKESEKHSRLLRELQNEQQKLLQLFYRGGVDEAVLQAEQQRIQTERTQAERWLHRQARNERGRASPRRGPALVRGCHETYMAADTEQRRLMNQAIFVQIFVRIDALEGEQEPVFAQIHNLNGSNPSTHTRRPNNGQGPHLSGGLGSNVGQMVRRAGLEPAPPD